MTKQIDVDGVTVEVTPIDELDGTWAFTAEVIIGRIQMANNQNDQAAVADGVSDLLEICTEDGYTSDGLLHLEPGTLNTLIGAMMPDDVLEDDQ